VDLSARHDAQRVLDRPATLADAGKRIKAEHDAMKNLLEIAEHEIRRGTASAALTVAARDVREAQRA